MTLPVSFISRMQQLLGEEDFQLFCKALQDETPVSVRMNSLKKMKQPANSTPVAWCSTGFYLDKRPTFTFDPLFHAGGYYVQEASSMFLEQVLRTYVKEPVVMLDLCAAPGGKSTLCRSLLPEGSFLVANEVMRNRVQVLAENLVKWGDAGVAVTHNDPSDFIAMGPVFDVVLADVPCSGEGMFRKDSAAVAEWSLDNVELCAQRQRRILRDIWSVLKPGGLLIYSTCTYNLEENETNVDWIVRELGAEVLSLEIPEAWNVAGNLAGKDFSVYRFLPFRTVGEGLFMAVMRKKRIVGEEEVRGILRCSQKEKKRKGEGRRKELPFPQEIKKWLSADVDCEWIAEKTLIKALPMAHLDLYHCLSKYLRVIHAGVTVCEQKGKDWIPHHSLAMSSWLNSASFPIVELTYEQAIAYLRKETLVLPEEQERGFVLLKYEGLPLGFVKNIGNRANNLYPQEWRIKSGYLPQEIQLVK